MNEKYAQRQNWMISPQEKRGENKRCLKSPPSWEVVLEVGKRWYFRIFFEEKDSMLLKFPRNLKFDFGVLVFLLAGWANVGTEIFNESSLRPTPNPMKLMVVPWCFHTFEWNPQHVITWRVSQYGRTKTKGVLVGFLHRNLSRIFDFALLTKMGGPF